MLIVFTQVWLLSFPSVGEDLQIVILSLYYLRTQEIQVNLRSDCESLFIPVYTESNRSGSERLIVPRSYILNTFSLLSSLCRHKYRGLIWKHVFHYHSGFEDRSKNLHWKITKVTKSTNYFCFSEATWLAICCN